MEKEKFMVFAKDVFLVFNKQFIDKQCFNNVIIEE